MDPEEPTISPKRVWQLNVNPENSAVLDEIEMLVQFVNLDVIAPRRHSALLALSMFGAFKAGRLNPYAIKEEIVALENNSPSRLKAPTELIDQPLKGLWHKHYAESGLRSTALNVKRGLKKFGIPLFQQSVNEAKEAGETRCVEPEHIPALVNDVVHGNWMRLVDTQDITGEWIIFAKHEGKNYYLAVATHDRSTHDLLRQNINSICCREFAFLNSLLGNE